MFSITSARAHMCECELWTIRHFDRNSIAWKFLRVRLFLFAFVFFSLPRFPHLHHLIFTMNDCQPLRLVILNWESLHIIHTLVVFVIAEMFLLVFFFSFISSVDFKIEGVKWAWIEKIIQPSYRPDDTHIRHPQNKRLKHVRCSKFHHFKSKSI